MFIKPGTSISKIGLLCVINHCCPLIETILLFHDSIFISWLIILMLWQLSIPTVSNYLGNQDWSYIIFHNWASEDTQKVFNNVKPSVGNPWPHNCSLTLSFLLVFFIFLLICHNFQFQSCQGLIFHCVFVHHSLVECKRLQKKKRQHQFYLLYNHCVWKMMSLI